MTEYKVGDKITFNPTAYSSGDNGSTTAKDRIGKEKVTGTIVQVNRQHRWYRVAYQTEFYGIQHECFKF